MTQDALSIPDALPDDVETLQRYVRELIEHLRKAQNRSQALEDKLDALLRRLYGPKSEKFNPNQPTLVDGLPGATGGASPVSPEPTPVEAPAAAGPAKPAKKGHGRRGFPEGLRRETVTHDLPEAAKTCPCCSEVRVKIGEEVSEKLDAAPASIFVVRHVRLKYGCPKCLKTKAETVHLETEAAPPAIAIAPPAPHIVDKCSAEPGLLAQIIVNKFTDHLPLARQETILARQGIRLSRQTMCDWLAACAEALVPIHSWMLARALRSKVIHCDETRVPVQDALKVRSGRLWVYLGDRDHPFTVYDYRTTKARAGPAEILKEYKGYLHADAANVFDGLYTPGGIVEVGCWAHARRHVYAALASDAALATQALARIGGLYSVEHKIAESLESQGLAGTTADDYRLSVRRRESAPQLQSLKQWIDGAMPGLLPKSPIRQGFAYIQRHWDALNRYANEGFLAIDNNAAERGFRPIGIGRRNWLFAGSDAGGRTAAILYSITQTCRDHKIDPWNYLKATLTKLPVTPSDRIAALAPPVAIPGCSSTAAA